MPPDDLTEEQIHRYSRQLIVPGFGGAGQARLAAGSVLVVGAGGLGSPVAYYLAAAGVGRIGLVDDDVVSLSNLQRQILHRTSDLGRPKVESGARTLVELNPEVQVFRHQTRLMAANALDLVSGYDVIVGALDNLPSRYVLNDACLLAQKPLVEAGVLRWDALLTTVLPGETACYRCIFPVLPPPDAVLGCADAGIIGPVAGMAGTIQAIEALKLLLGMERDKLLAGRLLVISARDMSMRTVAIDRNPRCAVCGPDAGPIVLRDEGGAEQCDPGCDVRGAR